MAKIKPKVWSNRTFINQAKNSTCTAHLYWLVTVEADWKDKDKAHWTAEFTGSDGLSLYACDRKGELRPMKVVQREINKFNDACEAAQLMVEEHNAKSKDAS